MSAGTAPRSPSYARIAASKCLLTRAIPTHTNESPGFPERFTRFRIDQAGCFLRKQVQIRQIFAVDNVTRTNLFHCDNDVIAHGVLPLPVPRRCRRGANYSGKFSMSRQSRAPSTGSILGSVRAAIPRRPGRRPALLRSVRGKAFRSWLRRRPAGRGATP